MAFKSCDNNPYSGFHVDLMGFKWTVYLMSPVPVFEDSEEKQKTETQNNPKKKKTTTKRNKMTKIIINNDR